MMLTVERLRQVLSYDPETGVWTRLSTGRVCSHKEGNGYIQFMVDGRMYRANRLAWFWMTGEWPPVGMRVDHKDRDRTNDRWLNLRLATHSQNKANGGAYVTNALGVKGVGTAARMKSRPYRARIQVAGKLIHLGYFETPEAANIAYAKAARLHFGDFAAAS